MFVQWMARIDIRGQWQCRKRVKTQETACWGARRVAPVSPYFCVPLLPLSLPAPVLCQREKTGSAVVKAATSTVSATRKKKDGLPCGRGGSTDRHRASRRLACQLSAHRRATHERQQRRRQVPPCLPIPPSPPQTSPRGRHLPPRSALSSTERHPSPPPPPLAVGHPRRPPAALSRVPPRPPTCLAALPRRPPSHPPTDRTGRPPPPPLHKRRPSRPTAAAATPPPATPPPPRPPPWRPPPCPRPRPRPAPAYPRCSRAGSPAAPRPRRWPC